MRGGEHPVRTAFVAAKPLSPLSLREIVPLRAMEEEP